MCIIAIIYLPQKKTPAEVIVESSDGLENIQVQYGSKVKVANEVLLIKYNFI